MVDGKPVNRVLQTVIVSFIIRIVSCQGGLRFGPVGILQRRVFPRKQVNMGLNESGLFLSIN